MIARESENSEDNSVELSGINMTPDQEQALKAHLEAIAQILYDQSDPEAIKTLEGIELTVRQKIQAHVSPELGSFLSARLAARNRASDASLKAL
jgi:hypothetical protein